MGLYIGIDFGTSTNYVVQWNDEKKQVEPEQMGKFNENNIIDNAIYYGKDNIIIGDTASKKFITDPQNVVKYIKRELDKENYSVFVPSLRRELSAKEISTDIFRKIKENVEKNHGGEFIDGVVVSVPFAFLHNERNKIKSAAEDAGLKVIGLIEEPVAAAISYVNNIGENLDEEPKIIMIFDLGGGTLDVTIFKCYRNNKEIVIEVLNTDGNKYLGGKDVDSLLIDKLQDKTQYYIRDIADPAIQKSEMLKFIEVAKETKEELAYDDETNIYLSLNGGKVELDEDITQDDFEEILKNNNFLGKIEETVDNAIEDIDLSYEDIDDVILVGGSSKLVPVKQLLEGMFDREPIEVNDPSLLVGEGAALYLGILLDKTIRYKIIPRLSQNIGIAEKGKFKTYIEKNSLYNTESNIIWYEKNYTDNKKISIDVYQGNTENLQKCSRVGAISMQSGDFQNKIGIKLILDKNGMILYKLYDEDNLLNSRVIREGSLDE